jgi:DNA-binding response OmpR family regulator
MAQILLLDDESELREEVGDFLRTAGHSVDEAGSIRQFRRYVPSRAYDVLVIDRALPDGEGLELVAELRAEGLRSGIVVFTARDASRDRIIGYESGADHYLTKPIRLDELAAVVNALARRVAPRAGWRLDSSEWSLWSPDGAPVRLTAQEQCPAVARRRGAHHPAGRRGPG